jgi:hypothetical protein
MSGKYTKKRIAIIIILAIAPVVAFIVYFAVSTSLANSIEWGGCKAYTRDELKQVFSENKEQFQLVVNIVAKNDKFPEQIKKEGDADAGIYLDVDSRYFSQEEWQNIVSLMKTVKPYMIMRSIKGGFNVVYFDFAGRKEGNKEISVALYYLPTEEERDYYSKEHFVGTLYDIGDGWYIGEFIDPDDL